jgi:hypothetical protein
MPRKFTLTVIPEMLAVCRMPPDAPLPNWPDGSFLSVTRTGEELSVVVPEAAVPNSVPNQRGFRALKMAGPLDFGEIGVLATLSNTLAVAGLSIFVISTYDTDYILVKQENLARAIAALRQAGHEVVEPNG